MSEKRAPWEDIEDVDMGSYYGYASLVVENHLGKLVNNKPSKIPRGVLTDIQNLFKLALRGIESHKGILSDDFPRAMCTCRLVWDTLTEFTGEKYQSLNELEVKVQELSNLTEKLKDVEQLPEDIYSSCRYLQKFFIRLHQKSEEANSMNAVGQKSKYTHILCSIP